MTTRTRGGQALAGRFYRRAVKPLLGAIPHAAGLLGAGSEVLGYDDDVSRDHDFGPRVQLFLPPDVDPEPVLAALANLPDRFDGYPVPHHRVEVTTAAAFFTGALGTDPIARMGLADWLLTPTQRLASLTAGAVFHDPDRVLRGRRAALDQAVDSTDILCHPGRCRAAAGVLGLSAV